jgi:hypothetical protein
MMIRRFVVGLALFTAGAGPAAAQGVGGGLAVVSIEGKVVKDPASGLLWRIYSAKFVIGMIKHNPNQPMVPSAVSQYGFVLGPGAYSTIVNIHNPEFTDTRFLKKAVQALPEDSTARGVIGKLVQESLPSDGAMELTPKNIKQLLASSTTATYTPTESWRSGFVVVMVPAVDQGVEPPILDVTAVYTNTDLVPAAGTYPLAKNRIQGPAGPGARMASARRRPAPAPARKPRPVAVPEPRLASAAPSARR